MGCCVSTSKSSPPKITAHISDSKTTAKQGGFSKSPPPTHTPVEEETVKEVLSETPSTILKHPAAAAIPRKFESPFIKTAPLLQQEFSKAAHNREHQNDVVCRKSYIAFSTDDVSEASEICSSLSESVSASTTVMDKKDTRYELRQRFKNRALSGEMNREKTVGRSPGRKSEPSPNRLRPVSGSGYGRRRDSGESSGRRSRSPVPRTEPGPPKSGLGRTQSARKTGKSPGRIGSGLGERIRKVDVGKDGGDNKWAPTGNELLENPLVSLECFIFL